MLSGVARLPCRCREEPGLGGCCGSSDIGSPFVNSENSLLIADSLPINTENSRLGKLYFVREITAAAPVAAIPTTTARVALWNGEPTGGAFYAIDSVFVIVVTSPAGTSKPYSVVGQLNSKPLTGMTESGLRRSSLTGRYGWRGSGTRTVNSRARIGLGQTVVNDNAWQALGTSVINTAAGVGSTVDFFIGGKIIVPPRFVFGISCLTSSATSTTVRLGIRWHEIRAPLGADS